ncbi:DUF4129 domain-containing protein [Xanthomonas translucens]|uniref:DUF4129 domain-containing protein n=1 Tax=Xanthomonas campestris pv. translucens TaxID=343 RepID=UPI001F38C220|nr:DUF4129 domain-containing protein [Xanthomonas translucens]MCS3360008.1 DUF4129 domain-containing protein [Xanthomonas translucens pv. translucens]MCS3373743.1 DUF4129 domain-containing protein [Xanthomonas translucens pv. translucens]MCT8274550.1 DUF4129 domain-containing protein [Xanthomonas translucens pv. translucens]MCT8278461.1 DUF4129 domain-containing protein [Xanthomonas translucens pv. translucens]MCT8286100.1 DUF4129 domain-containing protein [Xanthomonas translucens pv. transluc
MRIERLDVVLRARSAWEAMELGSALVRRHAGAIWKPWLLISVPLFALLNLGAWAIDQLWLAGLALWWLKPVLDRIPLFVISRGVFGDVPRVRDTLRAQLRWGWDPMFGYLTWRRLSPARSVFMPLELLEGASAEQQRQRRRSLGGAVYGHALLLASVCWHFEAMLCLACIAAILMFVPVELLPETVRAAWALIGDENPVWADVGLNVFGWLAMTLIEPFFVGAGFGLYLNRRTEIEAWDVEMALRRLRERLGSAAPLLLALVLLAAPGAALRAQNAAQGAGGPAVAAEPQARPAPAPQPAQETASDGGDIKDPAKAQEKSADDAPEPIALDDIFDTVPAAAARFDRAADRAYQDPLLSGKRSIGYWKKRDRNDDDDDEKKPDPAKPDPRFGRGLLASVAAVFAFVGEWGMWLLAGMLVLVLLLTARHWLPWMRGSGRKRAAVETPVAHAPVLSAEPLPDDVATSARRLWREGRQRDALALLYRASVATVCERANLALPPGATEAQCLRASRRLPDAADRDLFARMVRTWQYAAYAARLPDDDAFDGLLDALQQQYRWRA